MSHLLHILEEGIEGFLGLAVPLVAACAEIIGLAVIVVSLVTSLYHYIRVTAYHDDYDYHHEMSSGLLTALEFLMAAEVAKTILLPSMGSVLLLAATFGTRALMSMLLRAEMRSERAEKAEEKRAEHAAGVRAALAAKRAEKTGESADEADDVEEFSAGE